MLAKVPLLLLYVVFFFVQLFYNFGDSNHRHSALPVSIGQHRVKQQVSVKKSDTENHRYTKIRLNKRFQPETLFLDNADFVAIAVAAVYPTTANTYCYFGKFIPTTFLQTHLMRGPPVIA